MALEALSNTLPVEPDILHWRVDAALAEEARANYRTSYALSLTKRPALEIMQALTFDGQSNIDFDGIKDLLAYLEHTFVGKPLRGKGLELGAGPGTFSAAFASRPFVTKMYAVELCAPIVEQLLPQVMKEVLGQSAAKVSGVVGDFNHMELESGSIDFIFDFFALHHSTDLSTTLTESSRVLRSGGTILCLDKARPDYYTEQDLDSLLDVEYDSNYKAHFGLAASQKLTRRMNGEREYRLKDWRRAFQHSGFSRPSYHCVSRVSGAGLPLQIKRLLSLLPIGVQSALNALIPWSTPKHKFLLDHSNRVFSSRVNLLPKEISLLVATKI